MTELSTGLAIPVKIKRASYWIRSDIPAFGIFFLMSLVRSQVIYSAMGSFLIENGNDLENIQFG